MKFQRFNTGSTFAYSESDLILEFMLKLKLIFSFTSKCFSRNQMNVKLSFFDLELKTLCRLGRSLFPKFRPSMVRHGHNMPFVTRKGPEKEFLKNVEN